MGFSAWRIFGPFIKANGRPKVQMSNFLFSQKGNVPIILMGNELPRIFQERGPWAERRIPLHFLSHIEKLG